MQAGTHVLGSRYELVRHIVADEVSESWTGVDEYQTEYLVKVWPFRGDSPESFPACSVGFGVAHYVSSWQFARRRSECSGYP